MIGDPLQSVCAKVNTWIVQFAALHRAQLTLRSLGFEKVDVVSNGREVLKAMTEKNYELIFLDLHMPELDGLETAKAIRAEARAPRPFVVALTASAMSGDRERCLNAGMDDYVSKPLQKEDLVAVLARAKRAIETAPGARPSTPTVRSGGDKRANPNPAPPGVTVPAPGVVVDLRAVERLRAMGLPAGASGSDLVTELVDTFLKDVPDKLNRIARALAEADYLRAHRFTHSLVSAAGNLGALGVVKAARTLESVLRLRSQADSEQAYRALQAEFDLAAPELSRQRQKVN